MTPDFREDSYGERMRAQLGSPDGADYEHEAQRTERRWMGTIAGGALVIVAMVLIVAGLPSCAALPPCERYNFRIAEDNEGEKFVLIDMENVYKLSAMLEGVANGKCRIPKDGEV